MVDGILVVVGGMTKLWTAVVPTAGVAELTDAVEMVGADELTSAAEVACRRWDGPGVELQPATRTMPAIGMRMRRTGRVLPFRSGVSRRRSQTYQAATVRTNG